MCTVIQTPKWTGVRLPLQAFSLSANSPPSPLSWNLCPCFLCKDSSSFRVDGASLIAYKQALVDWGMCKEIVVLQESPAATKGEVIYQWIHETSHTVKIVPPWESIPMPFIDPPPLHTTEHMAEQCQFCTDTELNLKLWKPFPIPSCIFQSNLSCASWSGMVCIMEPLNPFFFLIYWSSHGWHLHICPSLHRIKSLTVTQWLWAFSQKPGSFLCRPISSEFPTIASNGFCRNVQGLGNLLILIVLFVQIK